MNPCEKQKTENGVVVASDRYVLVVLGARAKTSEFHSFLTPNDNHDT